MRPWTIVLAGVAWMGGASDSSAQSISGRAAEITVGGRLHAQYSASSGQEGENDIFLRRARLLVDIKVNDFFSARLQPDLVNGQVQLQDTYVRLTFSPAFRVTAGQMKRAFDLFELSSSTDLSIIERDGRIEGVVDDCAGVDGTCSFSRLTEKLQLVGRDLGMRVEGSQGRWSYMASVTNGTGINTADENDTKSYAARLTFAASEKVRISAHWALHDYLTPTDENARAPAWGGDVEIGTWRDGFHLQAGVVGGENWKAVEEPEGGPPGFLALQAVATFYSPMEGTRFVGVEPVVRLSFADPNRETAFSGGGAWIVTPGVMFYVLGKNKIGANLDMYFQQKGDVEYSLKVQSFLYF